jgi:hypothetical protein
VGQRVQRPDDLRTRLGEIAGWQTATRDDGHVAKELHDTHTIERVHALDEAAFFDEFFHYLKTIEVWPLIERLDPGTRLGPLYAFVQLILLTLMRCVGGLQSMLATHDLLLTDEALMGLLGFNAYQVEHGATARGLGQRTQPVSVRGPFSYETVADNLVAITPVALVELFNGAVRSVARQGVFAKHLDVVLDATDDQATPTYQTDDGRPVPSVTREKRPEVRANRHAQKVEVTVYGWKLWIVWEPQSKPSAAARTSASPAIDAHWSARTVTRSWSSSANGSASFAATSSPCWSGSP